MVVSTEG